MTTDTTIIMTAGDAEKFKAFVEHYDTFSLLLERGVFGQRSAAVSLNFDHNGVLQTIQRADMMWSRKFDDRR